MKISAIILLKNEEFSIVERAIASVSFCDEILVVHDSPTEEVLDFKANKKVRLLCHQMHNNFANQRNWAMEQAKNDWILFIDADEEVSSNLKFQISNLHLKFQNLSTVAYYLKRRDFWWGKELQFGETMKVRNHGLIRLVKKDEGVWLGKVHERFIPTKTTRTLNGFLNHYPHPTLKEFIGDINYYSTIRAHELMDQGIEYSSITQVFYPLGKFLLNYFLYLGFLDGPAGFAYAFLMSFHSFLVRAKLYQYTHINSS